MIDRDRPWARGVAGADAHAVADPGLAAVAAAEAGSATLWVIAFSLIVTLAAVAAVSTGAAVIARHRTGTFADVTALAAAGQIGVGDPCAAASRVAAENGVRLLDCQLRLSANGRSGAVSISLSRQVRFPVIGSRTVTGRAAAERLP